MISHCGCGNTLFDNVYLCIYIMYLYLFTTFLNASQIWCIGYNKNLASGPIAWKSLSYAVLRWFPEGLLDTIVVPVSSLSAVLILKPATAPCLASLGAKFSYSN